MSEALKCDRCGYYYEPSNCKEEFGTIEEYVIKDGESYRDKRFLTRNTNIDLCPGCLKAFRFFMERQYATVDLKGTDGYRANIEIPVSSICCSGGPYSNPVQGGDTDGDD